MQALVPRHPGGVARSALISLAAAAPLSATIGVGALSSAGYVAGDHLASTRLTWWVGDLAGALVITPVLVLWLSSRPWPLQRDDLLGTGLVRTRRATNALGAYFRSFWRIVRRL